MKPLLSTPTPGTRNRNGGFALIITVILLAFLLLLVVGLASLTKVETQVSENTSKQSLARQNALMALRVALGNLQARAGPDQRVTATGAAFTNADGAAPANPLYTGVWDATDGAERAPMTWLVSGNTRDAPLAFTPETSPNGGIPFVALVGEGTSGHANAVTVPQMPIVADDVPGQSSPTVIGHYAWWVGDEGVKADVTVSDRAAEVSYPPYDSNEAKRRLQQQLSFAGEAVDATGKLIFDPHAPDNATVSRNLLSLPQALALLAPSADANAIQTNFENWSIGNYGVLANTAGGGLRRDLSLDGDLPEGGHLLGDAFAQWADYARPGYMENPAAPAAPGPLPGYGADPVRRRYLIAAPKPGTRGGVAPVLTYFYLMIGVRKQNAAAPYTISLRWATALWNPYTSALVPTDLRLEVSGLPQSLTINARKSTAGVGTASPDVTLSLAGRYGEPLKLDLPWDATEPDSDRKSWLPGRTYNWVGTSNSAFTPSERNEGRFYSRNLPAFDDGLITTVASANGANGSSRLTLTLDAPTTLTVSVFRKDDPSKTPLATYTSPLYAAVPTTDEFKASNRTAPLGFIFRLAESYDSIATDPGLWLTQGDQDVRDGAIGPAALVAPPNGPVPNLYINYDKISAPERFFDRDITAGTSYNEDVPLFELPRAPLLSMGELQHFHLEGQRPFALGNPWGGAVSLNGMVGNAVFDRFFFSGLAPGVTPNGGANGLLLPNTLLKVLLKPDGSSVDGDDLKGAPEQASSRYLLQRGAFNINSTSAAAWTSLLRSSRYLAGRMFYYLNLDEATGTAGDGELQSVAPDGAVFFRFPQSAQETFKADDAYSQSTTSGGGGGGPVINVPLFRRGMRVLSPTQVRDLARWIADFVEIKLRDSGPFRSLEAFLAGSPLFGNSPGGEPRSLLQAAIAEARLNDASALGLNATDPEFSSQWLTQADLLSTLAPVLFARSDTFLIRAYGDVANPVTGKIEARAWCEARVQRIPEPVDSLEPSFRFASGPFGRKMRLLSLKWLNESDI